MRALSVTCLGLALLSPACKHQADGPIPVCIEEVAANSADEVKTQDLPAHVWFQVILKNYNPRTKELRRPTHDCSGRTMATEDQEIALCIAGDSDPVPLPARALDEEEDILVVPGDEAGQALIWIRTDHFENEYALGPVALAEWTRRGVAVRAIGPLFANTNKVRMRLEKMDEGKVLVVESNVCDPEKPKDCTRVMKLLPQVGYRFEERPLIDKETQECLGPATFELRKQQEVELDTGILRKFELTRSFDFAEGKVVLTEQVTIEDSDPKAPDAPPSVFRKAHVERPMRLIDKGVATGEGLWERMLSEHGAVNLRAKPAEGDAAGAEADAEGASGAEAKADDASDAPPAGGS